MSAYFVLNRHCPPRLRLALNCKYLNKAINENEIQIRLFNLRRTILSNYNQNAIQNAQFLGIRLLNMSRQFGGFSLQFEVQNFIKSEYFLYYY